MSISWDKVKVVIFDVDGTLYAQSELRKKMLRSLLFYYALRPWKFQELIILQSFRRERERRAGFSEGNLEKAQYDWCADKGNFSSAEVRKVVAKWIFNAPNQFLSSCLYPGAKDYFDTLRKSGIKIGIYSDYKAEAKLKALGLEADIVVSSTDKEVDMLKPNPKGLLSIAQKLRVSVEECVFIGDRQEMDGLCAERANMPYLILEKKPMNKFDFFVNLQEQLVFSLQAKIYDSDDYFSRK